MLAIREGERDARWNFNLADGTPSDAPGGIGAAVSVSYSFPLTDAAYNTLPGFAPFDSALQQATRAILAQIEAVANIDFVEVPSGGEIAFRTLSDVADSPYGLPLPAWSYALNIGDGSIALTNPDPLESGGDVWLGTSGGGWTAAGLQPGGWRYQTLLAEICHALGLDDPGSGNLYLEQTLQNQANTAVSHHHANTLLLSVTGGPGAWFQHFDGISASMPMLFDIEALQYLYGANTRTNAGNNTYQWGAGAEFLATIWDGGGIDTVDASNQAYKCVIQLGAGQHSSIGLRVGDAQIKEGLGIPLAYDQPLPADIYDGSNNLAIARGVVIEHANGGRAGDSITGNSAANRLNGNGGNDALRGLSGNDTLDGGAGDDNMVGGTGNDTYWVSQAGDRVTEAVGGGLDVVYSRLTSYTLAAEVEEGRILLETAANLSGNALSNVIHAGIGSNVMAGGAGIDTLSYQFGSAGTGVRVSLGVTAAQATGGSGTDTVSAFENLTGSNLSDRLTGNTGANVIQGLLGNDTLAGGLGRDRLHGGAGNDVFDFDSIAETAATAASADAIADFVRGQDRIDVTAIDANAATAGDDAFTFIGSAAFTTAGQLRLSSGIVYGNTDADLEAEFAIEMTGVSFMRATDFLL